MPKRMVAINYSRCRPGFSDNGICFAALTYPRRLIIQEEAYQIPACPVSLPYCAKCVLACPLKAIKLK